MERLHLTKEQEKEALRFLERDVTPDEVLNALGQGWKKDGTYPEQFVMDNPDTGKSFNLVFPRGLERRFACFIRYEQEGYNVPSVLFHDVSSAILVPETYSEHRRGTFGRMVNIRTADGSELDIRFLGNDDIRATLTTSGLNHVTINFGRELAASHGHQSRE